MNTIAKIRNAFDGAALKQVLEAEAADFEQMYDMDRYEVMQKAPNDFFLFKNNGARILFVAHLDTVHGDRTCNLMDTSDGPVVFSGALDDRLGAYVGLELLPSLGLEFDYLLTVGEESGQSTAAFFDPKDFGVQYNWIIEFDRGGTDVVLYQYESDQLVNMVEATGARVESGIFSDISVMEHCEVKALNWGVGYRDYHGPRSHAWLEDTFRMVSYFLKFHQWYADDLLEHEPRPTRGWWEMGYSGRYSSTWGDRDEPIYEETRYFDWDEWDCENWDMDRPELCAGRVDRTAYGVLCREHAEVYLGPNLKVGISTEAGF